MFAVHLAATDDLAAVSVIRLRNVAGLVPGSPPLTRDEQRRLGHPVARNHRVSVETEWRGRRSRTCDSVSRLTGSAPQYSSFTDDRSRPAAWPADIASAHICKEKFGPTVVVTR